MVYYSTGNKTFHWTWMCENEDDKMVMIIRMVNAAITMIIWSTWAIPWAEVDVSNSLQIGIVQVSEINKLYLRSVIYKMIVIIHRLL